MISLGVDVLVFIIVAVLVSLLVPLIGLVLGTGIICIKCTCSVLIFIHHYNNIMVYRYTSVHCVHVHCKLTCL